MSTAAELDTKHVDEPAVTEPTTTATEAEVAKATEPTATEPTVTEPTATEPTVTEPTATKPTATKPTATEPTEPTATEPTATKPTATEPTVSPVLVREVVWREDQKDLRAEVISVLRMLEKYLSTAELCVLVARYSATSGHSRRVINFEDAIRRGNPELFVYHARYAANQTDNNDKELELKSDEAESEAESEAKWNLPVTQIVPPAHLRGQKADEWRAINSVMQNFPQSRGMAIRECMRTDIDPTALGNLSWVLSATEGWTTPEWEGLADWLNTQTIGLWPSVAMVLRIETAKRQSQDSDM